MVEYASITAAISFFVTSLGGLYGSVLPPTAKRAATAISAVAQGHKVSGATGRIALKKAPYRRVELRYLYAVGWIGSASDLGACKAAQILGPDPVAAATQALEASPHALSVLAKSHVTVHQAATAIGAGTTAGCG